MLVDIKSLGTSNVGERNRVGLPCNQYTCENTCNSAALCSVCVVAVSEEVRFSASISSTI